MGEDSSAARSIDAFFRNPAFIMKDQTPQTTISVEAIYSGNMSTQIKHGFKKDLLHHQERQMSTANITSIPDEPVFWHGYTSDEEAASPIAVDDLDWDELDAASFVDLPPLLPVEEQRATIVGQAHQLCTHAQAVTILSAGRPKMVTVPRSIDSPRSACELQFGSLPNTLKVQTAASNHLRASSWDVPANDRSSGEYSSQKNSLDSNGCASPLSTAPSSILEQPPRPHGGSVSSKHIPLMEAARHVPLMEAARLGSSHSPTSPSLQSSYTWSSQTSAPTSAPTGSRSSISISTIKSGVLSALINKFDPSESSARRSSRIAAGGNNISRIGKQLLRKDTLEEVEAEYISKLSEPANNNLLQQQQQQSASPIIRPPTRTSSSKPSFSSSSRMIARGASERAPVLTLPACPDEFHRSATARITTVA